jgi:hypothetical protein
MQTMSKQQSESALQASPNREQVHFPLLHVKGTQQSPSVEQASSKSWHEQNPCVQCSHEQHSPSPAQPNTCPQGVHTPLRQSSDRERQQSLRVVHGAPVPRQLARHSPPTQSRPEQHPVREQSPPTGTHPGEQVPANSPLRLEDIRHPRFAQQSSDEPQFSPFA